MPVANYMIATPIGWAELDRAGAGAASRVLRVTCNGVTSDLTFGGAMVDGRNYWLTGDLQADADGGVGGVGDAVGLLRTCLRTHAQGASFNFTLSETNRLVITCSFAFSILWSHANTTLNALPFGFPQTDTVSGTSAAAPNQTYGAMCFETFATEDSRWRAVGVGRGGLSIAGVGRSSDFGESARERRLLIDLLPPSKALQEYQLATEPRGSWEWHWRNRIRGGRELRLYEDAAAARTSSSYSLAILHPDETDDPLERDPQYPVEWKLDLRLAEYTA